MAGDINSTLDVSIYDDNSGAASVIDANGSLVTTPRNPSGIALFDTNAHRGYIQLGDGTNLMPTMDGITRPGFIKITDGTNVAGVDSANAIYVSGKSAVGVAPSSNPLYIGGIDTSGLKRPFLFDSRATNTIALNTLPMGEYRTASPALTNAQVVPLQVDATGKLKITQANLSAQTIALSYDASISPLVANMWLNIQKYTVPANYQLEVVEFNTLVANANASFRFTKALTMGTYNVGTSTFTDQNAYTAPGFAQNVEAEITTVFTGTAVTFTVTYTNETGATGHTGTITTTAAPAVGQRFAMVLAAGDFGVSDITAVTKAGGTAGVCQFYGIVELLFQQNATTNQAFPYLTARQSIILAPGEQLQMDITHTTTTSIRRLMKVVGLLTAT